MIDQRLLRTDLAGLEAALARRRRPSLLDEVEHAARLDERLRAITQERDDIRARVNTLSKDVGALRRDGDVAAAEALQAESRELGDDREASSPPSTTRSRRHCASCCSGSPTCPTRMLPTAPARTTTRWSRARSGCSTTTRRTSALPHWDTATALGILDNERATKISGAMFTMQRGAGATLSRALCQYGLDLNADAFEEIRPPSLVTQRDADRHRPAPQVRRRRLLDRT